MTQSKPTTRKGRKKKERTRKFERPRHREVQHTCNIIYNDCDRGISDVAGNETPESLLSCGIPALIPS